MFNGVAEVKAKDLKGENVVVSELKKNDWFGEMGLLHNSQRTATVTARTKVEALKLAKENFQVAQHCFSSFLSPLLYFACIS
jgi:CRP-like cAMP-binding protein